MRTAKPRVWMAIGLAALAGAVAAPGVAYGSPPDLAVDGNGTAYFAYEQSDGSTYRVQDRWIPGAGTLSEPQFVSGSDGQAAERAIDAGAAGGAVHVWVRQTTGQPIVQTRRRSAGGTLGAIQTISPAGAAGYAPAVAVDAAGNAVYAWLQPSGTGEVLVRARRRTATGLLSAVQAITLSGRATNPRIEVDADGDAVISWMREGMDSREYLQARARAAGGALGPVQSLSATTADVTSASFAVAPDGRATFAWVARSSSGTVVHTRTRAADGTLSATQNLTPVVQGAHSTDTAVDANGNAVITWVHRSGEIGGTRARARSAAGVLGPIKALSSATCDASEPSVATTTGSAALLVWRCHGGNSDVVQAAERHPDGTYAQVQDVVASSPGYLTGIQLATAPDGTTWLSWLRGDTATSTLYGEARSRKADGALGATLSLFSYLT